MRILLQALKGIFFETDSKENPVSKTISAGGHPLYKNYLCRQPTPLYSKLSIRQLLEFMVVGNLILSCELLACVDHANKLISKSHRILIKAGTFCGYSFFHLTPGSLTEQAKNVFTASSPPLSQGKGHQIVKVLSSL